MKHKRSYQVLSVIGILLVCIVFVTLLPLAIQIVFELTTHIIGSSMTFSEWSKNDMGIICTDIIPSLGLILLCLWKFNGKKIISHSCSNFSTAYVPYIIILGICIYFPIGVIYVCQITWWMILKSQFSIHTRFCLFALLDPL